MDACHFCGAACPETIGHMTLKLFGNVRAAEIWDGLGKEYTWQKTTITIPRCKPCWKAQLKLFRASQNARYVWPSIIGLCVGVGFIGWIAALVIATNLSGAEANLQRTMAFPVGAVLGAIFLPRLLLKSYFREVRPRIRALDRLIAAHPAVAELVSGGRRCGRGPFGWRGTPYYTYR